MKQNFLFIICILAQIFFCKATDVIHVETIDALLEHLDKQTDLIVFDLDETLITLDHGERWLTTLCKEKNVPFESVKDFYMAHAMQDEHRLLEAHAPERIAQLQKQGYKIIALTARNTKRFVHHTVQQLAKLGIDFSRSGLASRDIILDGFDQHVMYHKGIVSCGSHEKGAVLMHLLDRLSFKPTKIIFLDDKLHHVESVKRHAAKKNIPCIGMRIGITDNNEVALSQVDHLNYYAWFNGLPGMFKEHNGLVHEV